jgi:hypothetical protein
LVAADALAREVGGIEPDVLVELAELYFEVYGEVDDPVAKRHSSAELYREAVKIIQDTSAPSLVSSPCTGRTGAAPPDRRARSWRKPSRRGPAIRASS